MKESDKTNAEMEKLAGAINNWPKGNIDKDRCHMFTNKRRPKYWKVSTVIRLLISLGIIYMIYKEAGPWTGFFAFLMFAHTESQYFMNEVLKYTLKSVDKSLKIASENLKNRREMGRETLDRIEGILDKVGMNKQGKGGAV